MRTMQAQGGWAPCPGQQVTLGRAASPKAELSQSLWPSTAFLPPSLCQSGSAAPGPSTALGGGLLKRPSDFLQEPSAHRRPGAGTLGRPVGPLALPRWFTGDSQSLYSASCISFTMLGRGPALGRPMWGLFLNKAEISQHGSAAGGS